MVRHQRLDHFLQRRPFDDLVQFVECEIDAVIRNPPLRKIIGANAFRAVRIFTNSFNWSSRVLNSLIKTSF